METRKIIAFGTSSFVVSLPKEWIIQNKLKKGDNLYIENNKGELVLLPGPSEAKEELKQDVINIDKKDLDLVRTQIVTSYLNGANVINIKGTELEKNSQKMKSILRNLTGMEIINQTNDKITAKDLLNIKEISVPTLIRRMDNIVRSMVLDSIDCLNTDHYSSIYERDVDVNRLVFLIFRVLRTALKDPSLARSLGMTNIDILANWIVATKLEKIGDQAKRIARSINEIKIEKKDGEEVAGVYRDIYNDYLEVMKAFYKKDLDAVFNLETTNKQRIDRCIKLQDCKNPGIEKILFHFRSMSTSVKNIGRAIVCMEEEIKF